MSENAAVLETKTKWLLIVSFVPFLVKAVDYSFLDAYVPVIGLVFFMGLIVLASHQLVISRRLAIRGWAGAIVLWGLARILIMGLFLFTSVSEAHVESQLTLWYVLTSIMHIGVGVVLWRWS